MNLPKSWHISTFLLAGIVVSIFLTAGNPNLGAGLMLVLFCLLPYWGWTLNDRARYRYDLIETRLREKLENATRSPDEIIKVTRNRKTS